MKGWYWSAVDRVPPPAWVTLKWITAERLDLYSYVPPPGENIPVSVEPFPVEDLVPMKDEIEWAMKQVRNHRSGEGLRDEGQENHGVAGKGEEEVEGGGGG